MSIPMSYVDPVDVKRLDYTLPPKIPGKAWVVHRRQAKLIAPHNAGAFPALHGDNKPIESDITVSPPSLRPQISSESGELTFILMPSVPSDYEHTRPIHFISMSAITQQELQAVVINPEYDATADELITIQIICSDTTDYHKYREQRNVLAGSPVLAKFFASSHFQPHARTTMIFTQYPSMLLQTVLMYLLHGADAIEALRVALMKFEVKERITRYIELVLLAKKFEMGGLTLHVIKHLGNDITPQVTPEHCIMLVEMLYLPKPVRDISIKTWVNQCITVNLDALWKMERFVQLAKTSWLKFEVDRFPTYEVCPWEAEDQEGGGRVPAVDGAGAGVVASAAAGGAGAAAGAAAGVAAGVGAGAGAAGGAGVVAGAGAVVGAAVGAGAGVVAGAAGVVTGGAAGGKKGVVGRLFRH